MVTQAWYLPTLQTDTLASPWVRACVHSIRAHLASPPPSLLVALPQDLSVERMPFVLATHVTLYAVDPPVCTTPLQVVDYLCSTEAAAFFMRESPGWGAGCDGRWRQPPVDGVSLPPPQSRCQPRTRHTTTLASRALSILPPWPKMRRQAYTGRRAAAPEASQACGMVRDVAMRLPPPACQHT